MKGRQHVDGRGRATVLWKVCGLAIIGGGVAAALPFQQPVDRPSPARTQLPDAGVIWRRAEEHSRTGSPGGTELFIRERSREIEPARPRTAQARLARISETPPLDELAGLPRLPATYEPLEARAPSPAADAPGPAAANEQPAEEPPLIRHRIVDGDTLERLATRYLGAEHRWQEIFDSNRDLLESPDLLPIGVELIISRRQIESSDNHLRPSDSQMVPIDSR